MKQLIALCLTAGLLASLVTAKTEQIPLTLSYGFTGSVGAKICSVFVYPQGSATPTYTRIFTFSANQGRPPVTLDTTIQTDSAGDWRVRWSVVDSNNIVWPYSQTVSNRAFLYKNIAHGAGTTKAVFAQEYDNQNMIFNGGFEFDSMDISVSEYPVGWIALANTSKIDLVTVPSRINNSRWCLQFASSANDTSMIYSMPFRMTRNQICEFGFDAYSTTGGGSVTAQLTYSTSGAVAGTTLDSVTATVSTGGLFRRTRKYFKQSISTIDDATSSCWIRLVGRSTTGDNLSFYIDNVYLRVVAQDSIEFVRVADTLKKATVTATIDYGIMAGRVWDTLNAHDVAVAADLSGCGAGSGVNLVQIKSLITGGSTIIPGAKITALNDSVPGSVAVATNNDDDGDGINGLNLNNGTYYFMGYEPGYSFTNQFITITGSVMDTLNAVTYSPSAPATANLCAVYFDEYDASGNPIKGVQVTAAINGTNVRDTSNLTGIVPIMGTTSSDANGRWSINLNRSSKLLPYSGYTITRKYNGVQLGSVRVTVPDSTTWRLSW